MHKEKKTRILSKNADYHLWIQYIKNIVRKINGVKEKKNPNINLELISILVGINIVLA